MQGRKEGRGEERGEEERTPSLSTISNDSAVLQCSWLTSGAVACGITSRHANGRLRVGERASGGMDGKGNKRGIDSKQNEPKHITA